MLEIILEDAKPHEVAIMMMYYKLNVKDARDIAKMLHYKDTTTVYRVLRKYRKIRLKQLGVQEQLAK